MPRLSASTLKRRLERREFSELFVEELGWERLRGADRRLLVDGQAAQLTGIASKVQVPVYLHQSAALPDRNRRRRIEQALSKQQLEHLVVFLGTNGGAQVWQWVKREPGRPERVREYAWRPGDSVEALRQKLDGLLFTLEEEEEGRIKVTEVTDRLERAFDAERITKSFYTAFKAQHDALQVFLNALPDEARSWYASVILNRLMFVYFIQKKGFIDDNPDYLNAKLTYSKTELGRDKFFTGVLSPLFFRGFALPEDERTGPEKALLGKVPYLNGGLFQQHQIERDHGRKIVLPDRAFEDLFAFFDGWRWHLDERDRTAATPQAQAEQGREINPDVLGYIFEKYINQKQMGAYYTREDITEYICANTILPRLLDKVRAQVPVAFKGEGSVWRLLADDPVRYIWPSVRHGLEGELPADIRAGETDPTLREGWARVAPREFGLPAETWREAIHRRKRCLALQASLAAGEVASPDAMVTANLDMARFVQDAIQAASEDQLKAWWNALKSLTVLDPACGSGAFLFAALNLLEPLYTKVFEAIQTTVADARRAAEAAGRTFEKSRYKPLLGVLDEAARHANPAYFVLRQVALNNLYGVDVMEEAAEICKLRLFLKLVAQLDDPGQIEPLPDLDFNIRSGNSLVGFASRAQLDAAVGGQLDFDGVAARIAEEAEVAAKAFDRFRRLQEDAPLDAEQLRGAKEDLRGRLAEVASAADDWLAPRYGATPGKPKAFEAWRKSHKPFHWFTEFHGVMLAGGFDAVVGNPPYVQRSKVTGYAIKGFETGVCPDIYAPFVEIGIGLAAAAGRLGLIVPISFQFSDEFAAARAVVARKAGTVWASTFSRNPAALFTAGLGVRNTIVLATRDDRPVTIHSSRLHRWVEESRPNLFSNVSYLELPPSLQRFGWPRLDNDGLRGLFERLADSGMRLASGRAAGRNTLRFKTTALYFLSVFASDPPSFDGKGKPIAQTKVGQIGLDSDGERERALAIALGKLSLLWWAATGDDFDVTSKGLANLPLSGEGLRAKQKEKLAAFGARLQRELGKHVIYTNYASKKMGNYDVKRVRPITDEADRFLLRCLGEEDAWESVELAYAHFLKMTRERHGTTRADLTEDDI